MMKRIMNLESGIKNICKKMLFFLVLGIWYLVLAAPAAYAQTVDPSIWQTRATGLRTQSNSDRKTAGLGVIVQQQAWPFISLLGGATNSLNNNGPKLAGDAFGIELGQIKIPNISGSFTSESADWSHNEMTFSNNFKIWISRLSPAILVQSPASSLRVFSGTVNGNELYTNIHSQLTSRTISRSTLPKYVAYQTSGGMNVGTIPASSSAALNLSSLNSNWLVVWFGSDSHFIDSKRPLNYGNIPMADAFQADKPFLMVFQNSPTSIIRSPEGGIDLTFAAGAGNVTLMPLFGKDVLRSSDTESWATDFPATVTQLDKLKAKAQWWADRLCSFPTTVSETYSYDQPSDTVNITENITNLPACSGGTTFAPIPPMLSIAKDAMGVRFSGPPAGGVIDSNYPTEFGPLLGIENTNQYTWSISGLKKYTDSQRIAAGTGQTSSELNTELSSQISKLIAAGHMRPWMFLSNLPRHVDYASGELYWANPADTIYQLTEIAPAISDATVKNNLINYIRSERTNYPPETIYDLSLTQGTARGDFSYNNYTGGETWTLSDQCGNAADRTNPCTWLHYQRVPLYNFLALSKYYQLTGDSLPPTLLTTANTVLDQDMREQDWATGFWFKGFANFYSYPQATPVENRHFAGLVGLINLAKIAGDTPTENLGRALMAKSAILRVAMAKYPRYLYSNNLVELPSDPAWMPNYLTTDRWVAYLFNYNWAGPYDDARQVAVLNQFRVYLHDTDHFYNTQGVWRLRGWGYSPDSESTSHMSGYLTGFRHLIPEMGRVLSDFARQDSETYINKIKAYMPDWYTSFAHGEVGREHDLTNPADAFQTFLAQAWISEDIGPNLAKYLDVPWLSQGGDIFYVYKLAETIKAYQEVTWEDLTYLAADVNQDHVVDLNDMNLLFGNWNTPRDRRADLSSDGVVNGIDFGLLVKDWGKTK